MTKEKWEYRSFVIEGKVYSANESHAAHTVYWAIGNSEADSSILIKDLQIEKNEKEK